MPQTVIPHVVANQTIYSLNRENSALEAAELMAEHDVSAVLVTGVSEKLIGIITERDITRRIVALKLEPKETSLRDCMTENLVTVSPNSMALEALEQMLLHKIRHIPVVENDQVVGVVSMRDLRHAIAGYTADNRSGPVGRIWRKFVRVVSGHW